MTRKDYVLAVLAAAEGAPLTPVQVQKLFFILDQRLGGTVGGPFFNFEPYHYGPFDAAVYREIQELESQGLTEIENRQALRMYRATFDGVKRGLALLDTFGRNAAFVRDVVSFVRAKSFSELVSAVYQEWPQMRAKSIFRD
jgi:uncharacterized protein